jgi:hypothetical protein
MTVPFRLTLLAVAVLIAAASAVALQTAGPVGAYPAPIEGEPQRFGGVQPFNEFNATFTETSASITNRIADLGLFQLMNTGTGAVEGFGNATVVLAMSQDRSVQPCGPGSWTNAGLRRIIVAAGVLVLIETAYVCQTSTGPKATGTWTVDGDASTGVFLGARGSGEVSVDLPTRTAVHTGKLKLSHVSG